MENDDFFFYEFWFFKTSIINQSIFSKIRMKFLMFIANMHTLENCIYALLMHLENHVYTVCLFSQAQRMVKTFSVVMVMYKNGNTFVLPSKGDKNLAAAKSD